MKNQVNSLSFFIKNSYNIFLITGSPQILLTSPIQLYAFSLLRKQTNKKETRIKKKNHKTQTEKNKTPETYTQKQNP